MSKKTAVLLLAPSQAATDLKRLGLRVLVTDPLEALPEPVRCHADLVCFPLSENRLLAAPGSPRLDRELSELGFALVRPQRPLGNRYPDDTPLCALRVGARLFCREASVDPLILQSVPPGHRFSVNQGYTRCSALPVGENALVTADLSIARAAEGAGVEVLRIKPGHIRLDGYDTGFIGGCGGMIGPDTLFLTGRITHPDGERIRAFAKNKGIDVLEGGERELVDIGSVLLLGFV